MAEREDRRFLSTLPIELQYKLGFQKNETGEWLVHDEFVGVGNVQHGEWVPSRVRVSKDGTRYEIGAHIDDIEGILALNKTLHPTTRSIDQFLHFWNNSKKFGVSVEGEIVFIGTSIQPTPMGFEEEFRSLIDAYDIALTGVIQGKSYEELLDEDRGKEEIERAERIDNRGRTLFFSTLDEELYQGRVEPTPEPTIETDSLADFPIGSPHGMLNYVPGHFRMRGEEAPINSAFVAIQHKRDTGLAYLFIWDPKQTYDHEAERWNQDILTIHLPISGDHAITTLKDVEQLTLAQVKRERDTTEQLDVSVQVSVSDDELKIKAADDSFDLTLRKPTCDSCGIPNWKFPFPIDDSVEEWDEKSRFVRENTDLGILSYDVSGINDKKCVCANCVRPIVDDYLRDKPFSTKKRAMAVARRRLDGKGYPDVDIWKEQVWRTGDNGWYFMTKIIYERDGRKINRYTGAMTLTDEGGFESDISPREYVNFRYKA